MVVIDSGCDIVDLQWKAVGETVGGFADGF